MLEFLDKVREEIDIPNFFLIVPDIPEDVYWKEIVESSKEIKCEYIEGRIFMSHSVRPIHDDITTFMSFLLKGYVAKKKLGGNVYGGGNVLVKFSSKVKFQPDIFYISEKRLEKQIKQEYVEAPIELVIEVISPTYPEHDKVTKLKKYEKYDVPEYIWIDPHEQELRHHILSEKGKYEWQSYKEGKIFLKTLKGFWICTEWFWKNPIPNAMEILEAILLGANV